MSQDKLVIFVKNAKLGEVKTRLAAGIGDELALKVYLELLKITHQACKRIDSKKEVWYSKYIENNDLWNIGLFEKKVQYGNNLGERMKNVFQESFENERLDKVILIGSDCPNLTTDILNQAFKQLSSSDLVLGPAEDGGYYLIGMSKYIPDVLKDMEWSVESVFSETLKRAQQENLSYSMLPTLFDIDTVEELKRSTISY